MEESHSGSAVSGLVAPTLAENARSESADSAHEARKKTAPVNILRVKTNDHVRIFDETIEILKRSFCELGHAVICSDNYYKAGFINILCGSTLIATRHHALSTKLAGKQFIVYQLEQLHDDLGHLKEWPEYMSLLRNACAILEYSPSNMKYLESRRFENVSFLPPAYHPALSTFTAAKDKDIDVLMIGAVTPRRLGLFRDLAQKNPRVFFINKGYGDERNAAIARSKIVLNVHAIEGLDILETIRLQLLLSNSCFVISELADYNPYGDGVVYGKYGELVNLCMGYLAGPAAERDRIAAAGFKELSRTRFTDNLKTVLRERAAFVNAIGRGTDMATNA